MPDGGARESHAAALGALLAMPASSLHEREALLEREKAAAGVVFRPTASRTPLVPVDFVPRILTGEDWSRLQGARPSARVRWMRSWPTSRRGRRDP